MAQALRLLRWLYVGRLTVAAGIFVAVLWAWRDAAAETTLLATLAVVWALGWTLAGVWSTGLQGAKPRPRLLYGQLVADAVLVTAVVHLTTAERVPSDLSPLYVLVIAAAAVLVPLRGALSIAAVAIVLYVTDMVMLGVLNPGAGGVQQKSLWIQVCLFLALAAATAALGHRLRRTGTQLGRMELQLQQLRLDTNDILSTLETGLVTVDGLGRLVLMNPAAQALLSVEERSWRGKRVLDELDRAAPGLGAVIRQTAETRVPVRRHEIRVRNASGDRYLGMRTTMLERRGQPWVTAVMQDITESKQIDDLIRRAERLQAVAELGASLAHEIKNPLSSIRSAVEQLAGARVSQADRRVLGGLVLTESDRLSRLLTEFMEFSRVELRRWKRLDLREVVTHAVELASRHPDANGGARIELHAGEEPLDVDGDQDLLHRIAFNLVLNAVQHSGQGGTVRIDLGRVADVEVPASVSIVSPVRLTVQDSGPGIEPQDVPRLFDPFYTTRNGGNGLGLAMVHRAVEAHRGAILVDPNPGRGARFSVYLPGQNGVRS